MRDFFGNRLRLRILFQEIIASGTKQGDYNSVYYFFQFARFHNKNYFNVLI